MREEGCALRLSSLHCQSSLPKNTQIPSIRVSLDEHELISEENRRNVDLYLVIQVPFIFFFFLFGFSEDTSPFSSSTWNQLLSFSLELTMTVVIFFRIWRSNIVFQVPCCLTIHLEDRIEHNRTVVDTIYRAVKLPLLLKVRKAVSCLIITSRPALQTCSVHQLTSNLVVGNVCCYLNDNLLQVKSYTTCSKLSAASSLGNFRNRATCANPAWWLEYTWSSVASCLSSVLQSFGVDNAHCIAHMANGRM